MRGLKLKQYQLITLIEMRKYHPKAKVRERAHALELLGKGKKRKEVAEIFGRTKDTISDWTVKYNKYGIAGLFDKERPGRPREVTDEIRNRIIEIAESEETCSKYSIKEDIEDEFGIRFHPNTIKYHLKKKEYLYKRIRKSLNHKKDETLYNKAEVELEGLQGLAEKDEITLLYLDESGFSGDLPVNYSWIKKGQQKHIPKINDPKVKINVLGLFDYKKEDMAYSTTPNKMDSDVFIGLFDITKPESKVPVYVVVDNHSIHTSNKTKKKELNGKKRIYSFITFHLGVLN